MQDRRPWFYVYFLQRCVCISICRAVARIFSGVPSLPSPLPFHPSFLLSLPLPSPPLLFPSPSLPSLPLLTLEVGPLRSSLGIWGAVSSPSGVWGGAPAENEFGVF